MYNLPPLCHNGFKKEKYYKGIRHDEYPGSEYEGSTMIWRGLKVQKTIGIVPCNDWPYKVNDMIRCEICGDEIEAWKVRTTGGLPGTDMPFQAYQICQGCQREQAMIPITILVPEDEVDNGVPIWLMRVLSERWHSLTYFDVLKAWVSESKIRILLRNGSIVEESLLGEVDETG